MRGHRRMAAVGCVLLLAGCGTPPPEPVATPAPGGTGAPTAQQGTSGTSGTSGAPTGTPGRSSTSAPATPGPTGAPGRGRTASVVMNGDLLWHNTLWFGAKEDAARQGRKGSDDYDFTPLLAGIRPVVEGADLAICHNEVPVSKPGGSYSGYPAFSSPPYTLDAVKAIGYDMCTTASNHSLDKGFDGLKNTLDQMDARGLKHAGTARTKEEADTPTVFTTAAGVKIAVIEGTYDTNGIPRPSGKEWSVPTIEAGYLLGQAKKARQGGADIVMVAVHGGEEYQNAPNEQQRSLAQKLTASPDVDLVYGHHVHVVQPITKVNGKFVVYGLGNLVAQHKTDVPMGYEGITTRFVFAEKPAGGFEVKEAEWDPTLVTHYSAGSPARVGFVNEQLTAGKGDTARLKQAKSRTEKIVTMLGPVEGLVQK